MSKVTITCKNCGHELPAGSSFCDKCGEKVANRKKFEESNEKKNASGNSKIAFIAGVGIALIILSFMISFISGSKHDVMEGLEQSQETLEDRLSAMSCRVTPELYEQIEFGMDYDEVVALLGEEGAKDYGNNYEWPGEYFDMAEYVYDAPTIRVEFGHTMKAIGISEHNVICGEKVYGSKRPEETDLIMTDEKLSSMKARMSYREIADIIGAEGRLTDASSDKSGSDTKRYEWVYIRSEGDTYPTWLDITFYNDKAQRSKYDEWGE